MLWRTKPLAWLSAGLVLVSLVGAAGYWFLGPNHLTRHVAVPEDSASPEEVVRAYLEALDAHDSGTGEALVTPEHLVSSRLWFRDMGSLSVERMSAPYFSGPGCGSRGNVVGVGVTLDVDWRWFHDDPSVSDGRIPWGFLLVRPAPDEPWRICDEGLG